MPDLPEVTQEWAADVGPYVAAMAELIDATARARDAAIADMAAIQAAIDAIRGRDIDIGVNASAAAAADRDLAAASREAAAAADSEAGANYQLVDAEWARANMSSRLTEAMSRETAAAGDVTRATYEETLATDALIRADLEAAAAAEARARAQADAAEQSRIDALMQEMLAEGIGNVTVRDQDWINTQRVMAQAAASTARAFALRGIEARAAADADGALETADAALVALTPTASGALRGIIGAMQGSTQATRVFGLSLSALHWIFGVSAEALAVLIPAIIAFGAGLDVAMQGAMNAASHMQALWTAAEATGNAFHQTLGTLLGLKPALQQAQDAANPGVYEILGSAVNDAKAHMSSLATAGLDVVHMWDEFSARITVDMQTMAKSGEMQSLLGNMVSDLQQLGQVFGNVGHAILNFAADMPGLAEVLLGIVDGISKVILWISQLPPWLIEGAMALEEFYRWGGLVASIIARIGLVLPMIGPALLAAPVALFGRLAAIMGAVTGVGAQLVSGLASVAGGIARLIPAASGAETALSGLSEDLAAAAENTALMGGIGVAIAAVAALGLALDHIRNPAQQFADSINKAVASANDLNVMNVLATSIVATAQKMNQYSAGMNQLAAANARGTETLRSMEGPLAGASQGAQNLNDKINSFVGHVLAGIPGAQALSGAYETMTGASSAAAVQAGELDAEQHRLLGTFSTVAGNVSYLAQKYHISGAAAQVMAQEAGVNLTHALTGSSQAAQIARQQIANLVTGLGAMSAPAGVVGNDMEALGIQSQLAGTKVQQLNQAWDAWMGSVTGAMSSMSQVQTAIATMGNDVSASTVGLTGSISSLRKSSTAVTYTLKGMGQTAMQSWQQLTSALNTGNSALDQLRTGMAEGVITGGQFKATVQGLVGEMVPFVAGNRTATEMLSNLGHEAGGPVTQSLKQLEQWAGVKGKAAADQFSKGMNDASQAMGNMSKVAQDLSAVVSGDLDQALAASITKTSGVSAAVQQYSRDLANSHTPASTLHGDVQAISQAMQREQQMTAQASQGINHAGNSASHASGQMSGAARSAVALAHGIDMIHSKTVNVTTNFMTSGTNPYPGGISGRGAHGGMVAGGGIIPSFAQGGVIPGFAPGVDNMLALLSRGESILNPYATQMLGGKPAIDWLNSTAWHGGGHAGGGGNAPAAGGGQVAENHVHVYLDGKEIYASVKQQNYIYGTRNAGSRTGLMTPGTRT